MIHCENNFYTTSFGDQRIRIINDLGLKNIKLSKQEREWVIQVAEEVVAWSWEASEKDNIEWLKKVRESGLEVIELTDAQTKAYSKIVLETEIPIIEKMLGKEKVDAILKAANVKL